MSQLERVPSVRGSNDLVITSEDAAVLSFGKAGNNQSLPCNYTFFPL